MSADQSRGKKPDEYVTQLERALLLIADEIEAGRETQLSPEKIRNVVSKDSGRSAATRDPVPRESSAPSERPGESMGEILDACCGGRMWWWDKAHPLAVYMDNRIVPRDHEPDIGSEKRHGSGSWACEPTVVGDFRAMPFDDKTFHLVLFDPPHVVRDEIKGHVTLQYGALPGATEQDDLRRGFAECWRVLAPGGTLVFKWAGKPDRVRPHFPADPIVGTKVVRKDDGLGTRWFIFYKPVAVLALVEDYQEAMAV